jgi:hypothetical protein
MIPGNNFALELAAGDLRRRARAARARQRRAADFAAPEWPPSRGPTPNPKRC